MTERLIRWWAWIGRRRLFAGWAVAMLGLLTFGGGIALGATREQPSTFTEARAATVGIARPRTTAIEALIVGRRPAGFIARTRTGDLLVVRTTEATTYRRRGRDVDAAAVRRGARVFILGRPAAAAGAIVARVGAVRGYPRGQSIGERGQGQQD